MLTCRRGWRRAGREDDRGIKLRDSEPRSHFGPNYGPQRAKYPSLAPTPVTGARHTPNDPASRRKRIAQTQRWRARRSVTGRERTRRRVVTKENSNDVVAGRAATTRRPRSSAHRHVPAPPAPGPPPPGWEGSACGRDEGHADDGGRPRGRHGRRTVRAAARVLRRTPRLALRRRTGGARSARTGRTRVPLQATPARRERVREPRHPITHAGTSAPYDAASTRDTGGARGRERHAPQNHAAWRNCTEHTHAAAGAGAGTTGEWLW